MHGKFLNKRIGSDPAENESTAHAKLPYLREEPKIFTIFNFSPNKKVNHPIEMESLNGRLRLSTKDFMRFST